MSAQPPRHGVGWVCEGFCPHPEGRGIPEHLHAATFVLLVTPDGQKYVTVPRGMALGKLLGVSLRLLTPPSSPVYQCEPSFTGAPTPGSRVNIANICLSIIRSQAATVLWWGTLPHSEEALASIPTPERGVSVAHGCPPPPSGGLCRAHRAGRTRPESEGWGFDTGSCLTCPGWRGASAGVHPMAGDCHSRLQNETQIHSDTELPGLATLGWRKRPRDVAALRVEPPRQTRPWSTRLSLQAFSLGTLPAVTDL